MSYVYIVLINYNGWEHTIECVDSIFNNSFKNFKIVIVDNNSAIGFEYEREFYSKYSNIIKKLFAKKGQLNNFNIADEQIILIKNDSNDGFAAGCNCAFSFIRKQNDCEYVWLLGTDNIIDKEALNNLIKYIKNNDEVGLCGSISLSYYQRDVIQCAGVGAYNKWTASSKHLLVGENINKLKNLNFNEILKTYKNNILYVYGNSMFFSKKLFVKLQNIPENYFIYYEELEMMQQLKKLDMEFGVATDSFVYHKEGSSTGGKGKSKGLLADYYNIRNRILFTKKYYKYCLPTVYLGLVIAVINRIKRKQFNRIPMILKLLINPYPKFNER